MNLTVTNKPYSVCSEDCKVKANTKSLSRSKLQSLCPVAPTNFAPKCVSASIVDAIRVVQIIPKKVPIRHYIQFGQSSYLHTFVYNNIAIAINSYNCQDDQFISLSKERLESSTERNINSLNQVLPNAN